MLPSRLGLFYQSFRLLDNGGDVCRLLVWAFTTCFQAFAGYWGRCLPSPCLGLYHLLSGLCRILGEMYAVSFVWVFYYQPSGCWVMGEMSATSLSGFSNTSLQVAG